MGTGTPRSTTDAESAEWVASLQSEGPARDEAIERLHRLLVRVGRSESHRRSGTLALTGPEVDDIAQQAADDALLAILRKITDFRGESRFTTWALKFVILEVASKVSRHHWRRRDEQVDTEDWARLPVAFGFDPAEQAEWSDLMAALRRGIDQVLTAHQRRIFRAVVVNQVPLDVVADEIGSNRNAIYKTIFDARRKLRASLIADGYLDNQASRKS